MKNSLLRKMPDYYIVSLLSVGVNLVVYGFLVFKGINYLVAIVIGFVIETILAYLLNRFWTFSDTLMDFKIGYLRSFLVAILNLLIIMLITFLGIQIFKLNYLIARIVAGVIVGIISFILDAKFSFAVWPKKN